MTKETQELTQLKELAKMAWRCIDEGERVIETIEPENDIEGAMLLQLRRRMTVVSMALFNTLHDTPEKREAWFYGNTEAP